MSFKYQPVEPTKPIVFDIEKCISCNRCVNVCPIDLMLPALPGKTPFAAYPDECWYCGSCVVECPTKAVSLHHPLMNQPRWVSKKSLEEVLK